MSKQDPASTLVFGRLKFFYGALTLQSARGFQQNIFSTAIKFQFAAQLKVLFAKTSFQ